MVKEFISRSEEETLGLARKLAAFFSGREVVLVSGELGAGKTVFAKGLAAGLGIADVHQVCSPSYTLINIYDAKYPIYHIDLYRLGGKSDIEDLGWEEFLGQGVIIVEWAEKLDFVGKAIRVRIETTGDKERKIRLSSDLDISLAVFP
jgi:tRNA threonylcarbamoyladenosine biosynthesis protein TsaE